jgi:hypothetical protein
MSSNPSCEACKRGASDLDELDSKVALYVTTVTYEKRLAI